MSAFFCPTCGKPVKPPLSTGRQFCSECGWKSEITQAHPKERGLQAQHRDIGFEALEKLNRLVQTSRHQFEVSAPLADTAQSKKPKSAEVVQLIVGIALLWGGWQSLHLPMLGVGLPFGKSPQYEINVSYTGEWSGSIGSGSSQRTENGTSSRSFTVDGYPAVAVVQKKDDNSRCMDVTVSLVGGSDNTQQTCAAYGVVSVTGPSH
jgi:uncharacterized Zn finger protein (UPF0148 family)